MFTILGADGKEYGPVTADKIREWITGGRANLQTKARRVDETGWKTLGDFTEFGGAGTPPPAAADATPGAATPVRPAGPVDPKAFADDLLARAAPLDVFDCLGRSFELWKSNFLPLVGVTLLAVFVQCVANMIPILGFLCSLLLTGVFTGGIYYYYIGKLRGEPRDVGDVFAGFTKALVPLLVTGLIINLVSFALVGVFFAPLVLAFMKVMMAGGAPGALEMPVLGGMTVAWMILGIIPILYIGVAWAFAYALVIDQGLGPWTALEVSRRVVTRYWFRVFFTVLLGGILAALGIIGLFIGVLFTLPLAFGAIVCAYDSLCNPPPKA